MTLVNIPYGTTLSDAFAFARSRGILPTWMGTAELRELEEGIRARAVFSARTTHAGYLQALHDELQKLAEGGYGSTEAEIRARLKETLRELGYDPLTGFPGDEQLGIPPARPGSLQDLASDRRINLILDTQAQLIAGKGQQQRGLQPAALDLFPAYEFVRIKAVRVPREWLKRWAEAADNVDWKGVSRKALEAGRMVALKTSPIWAAIGSSALFDDALDVSHPPFCFNSGMGWREVEKAEAEQLGLGAITASKQAQNDAAKLPPAVASTNGLSDDFLKALTAKIDKIEARDGKLTLKGSVDSAVQRALKARQARTNALCESLDVELLRLELNAGTRAGALKGWQTRRQIRAGADALKAAVQGQKNVERAMHRSGLGFIDFLWGARGARSENAQGATHWGGWGVHHVESKRGKNALKALPIVLAKGRIGKHEQADKRYVRYAGWTAVVRQREPGRWSVTTLIDDDIRPKKKRHAAS